MDSLPLDNDSKLSKAVHYHQSGQLHEAEQMYHCILETEAEHPEALHMLGLLAHQKGRSERSLSLISKAIEIKPYTPQFHCSLGGVFQDLGNTGRAIVCYQKAIELDPGYYEALYNLGNAYQRQTQFREAIDAYRTALKINPKIAEIHHNLGRAQLHTGNFQDALSSYQRALEIRPAYADAHIGMGNVYQELGMPEKSLDSYRSALEINPDSEDAIYNTGNLYQKMGDFNQAISNYRKSLAINPHRADACSNLGLAYMKLGKSEDAITALRQAVSINPGDAEYHFNLGNAFLGDNRFGEAIGCYKTALEIFPGYHDALINMGNAMLGSGRFEEALTIFHKALECAPQSPMAHNNLGKAYQDQGEYQKARRYYRKALAISPDYAEGHFNHAFVLLMMGEFAEGWPEYEWRFKRSVWEKTYPHRLPGPRWDGSNFAGKRLLIHCEQGYGDIFQFVRYLPMVKNRGGTVILEVMRSAKGLLENHPAVDELLVFSTDRPPAIEYDLYIPLLSLPGLFGTNIKSIPAGVPYLHADPRKSNHWSKQLSGSHFRVGLVWSGSATDPNRSCALSCFSSLAEIEGLRLYGLQKGPAANQAEQLSGEMKVANLENESGDFSDTAGAIENLDLVISIDTSVAHLAGAMGKPVWVLIPFAPDWRWQPSGDFSPWYPTMKLYRQTEHGDWQSVCNRVAVDLAKKLAKRHIPAGAFTDHYDAESKSAHQHAVNAYQAKDYRLARDWIEKALDGDTDNPIYRYGLGLILITLNKIDKAIVAFQQAVKLKPDFAEAHFNLGLALKKQGRLNEALSSFERALKLNPDDAEAWYNTGNILKSQGDFSSAQKKFTEALKIKPEFAEACNNLGLVLKEQGMLEASIEAYQRALELKPGLVEAHWNLGLAQLLSGNYAEGWAEYEWRFKREKWISAHRWSDSKPIWDGSVFKGRRLLVRGEQGIGDQLQFIRYLPLVKSRGGTVIFETRPALQAILADFPGIDEIISSGLKEDRLPHYDMYVPLMSLSRIFKTGLNSIPAAVPYLRAPDRKVPLWRNRITGDGLRVGIVWAGRAEHENDANRSIPLEKFVPLTAISGIHLYGIQKGVAALEADQMPPGTNLYNLGGELEDFADTAGLIENLDLVISVDTSVAHLAGAMARPVWVLLPYSPDWRWLMHRDDSPWYPGVRLFRAPGHGRWDAVMEKIGEELRIWANGYRRG